MSRRLDLGQFVSRSTIIAGTAFVLRDASPLLTPDLVHSPQPGNVWHTSVNIFQDHAQQETHRDKTGHPHHIDSHDFERRRAKINTSHFHESRFHPSVRNDGESGFMGGDTGFNSQSTIGMGTIYSSFSEGEHYEPSTAEVGKHGKVLAKLVSGMASDRQNGEGGETGKRSLRDLNTLEYQLRHFTSLSLQQQQEAAVSFFTIASELPPAPEGWLPDLTPEQMDWFLGEVAVGAVAGAAMALVYEATTKKGIKKALPVLASIGMLISACGGNVVSTATGLVEGTAPALKPPLADPNVKVVTGTPGITATAPKDLAVVLGGNGAEGGLFQTCEAEVARLQAQYKMPEGLRIPQDIVVFHGSDPNKWTPAEKAALVDGQGKSIAPTIDVIKGRIEKINPKIRVKAIWSGEGYVLHLTDENGKEVWAVGKNGIPSYRPDMITDTEKFRLIPDPPVDGEKRYVVANGCGVLGIFDKKGNMIAVYKPLANKWELFLPATATPAIPTATTAPVPTSTPDWGKFVPTTLPEVCSSDSEWAKNKAKDLLNGVSDQKIQEMLDKAKNIGGFLDDTVSFFQPGLAGDPRQAGGTYREAGLYQKAVYIGSFNATINVDFGISKNTTLPVKMGVFIPADGSYKGVPIITIENIFYRPDVDQRFKDDYIVGYREALRRTVLPSGSSAYLTHEALSPGQVVGLWRMTGAIEVDLFNKLNKSGVDPIFVGIGGALRAMGIQGANEIFTETKQNNLTKSQIAEYMKTLTQNQQCGLLARVYILKD